MDIAALIVQTKPIKPALLPVCGFCHLLMSVVFMSTEQDKDKDW
jgi:hypothetical protein